MAVQWKTFSSSTFGFRGRSLAPIAIVHLKPFLAVHFRTFGPSSSTPSNRPLWLKIVHFRLNPGHGLVRSLDDLCALLWSKMEQNLINIWSCHDMWNNLMWHITWHQPRDLKVIPCLILFLSGDLDLIKSSADDYNLTFVSQNNKLFLIIID